MQADSGLKFTLRLTLPKDGNLRRDTLEAKQNQVEKLLYAKLKPCFDFDVPKEIVISLTVVQDPSKDGNLVCGLLTTASDLLLQLSEESAIKRYVFGTTCLKLASKYLVDPWSLDEACLSNNLVLTTCYKSKDADKITATVDKGADSLRFSAGGAQEQSAIQLEYSPATLTMKELRDISEYVRTKLAPTYFSTLLSARSQEYVI